jgi:N-acetylglutamate synthase-like GNAT family acetyltransferase
LAELAVNKKKLVQIKSFNRDYVEDFYELNRKWIEESWKLEISDINDLTNPKKYIIDNGGEIFFAMMNDQVIGTAAMVLSNGIFELAKMTVIEECRGLGIANKLMDRCIEFAIYKKTEEIVLITNSALVVARNLYDKYGFKEVKLDSDKYGERGDVKMVLKLSAVK